MKKDWMKLMNELGLGNHCLPIQIFDFTTIVVLTVSVIALVPVILTMGF